MGVYDGYGRDISRSGVAVRMIQADERFERHLRRLAERKKEMASRPAVKERTGKT